MATHHFPIPIEKRYAAFVNPFEACHEAAIRYAEANPGANGAIGQSSVDTYLSTGYADPGLFTYVITSPGTVTTYMTVPVAAQSTVISRIQKLYSFALYAGIVTAGNIVPLLPNQPVAAPVGVPNGVIAIQTIVRNH